MDIEEVGCVKFRGCFLFGMDLDYIKFVSDNDLCEIIEVWEVCFVEGVWEEEVVIEVLLFV